MSAWYSETVRQSLSRRDHAASSAQRPKACVWLEIPVGVATVLRRDAMRYPNRTRRVVNLLLTPRTALQKASRPENLSIFPNDSSLAGHLVSEGTGGHNIL